MLGGTLSFRSSMRAGVLVRLSAWFAALHFVNGGRVSGTRQHSGRRGPAVLAHSFHNWALLGQLWKPCADRPETTFLTEEHTNKHNRQINSGGRQFNSRAKSLKASPSSFTLRRRYLQSCPTRSCLSEHLPWHPFCSSSYPHLLLCTLLWLLQGRCSCRPS